MCEIFVIMMVHSVTLRQNKSLDFAKVLGLEI